MKSLEKGFAELIIYPILFSYISNISISNKTILKSKYIVCLINDLKKQVIWKVLSSQLLTLGLVKSLYGVLLGLNSTEIKAI